MKLNRRPTLDRNPWLGLLRKRWRVLPESPIQGMACSYQMLMRFPGATNIWSPALTPKAA